MKKFYQTCLLGVCMTITAQFKTSPLHATHAQGADISYQCLGGSQYNITVSFYRDCAGVGAPANVTVNLSSASCGQDYDVTLFPVAGTGQEVSPVCATMSTTCTGGGYPGVQEWQYSAITTLPAACSDWVFSFTLCCRNNAISTIDAPGSENIYVEAHLDNLNYPCNNSPVFSNPPVPFVCVGQTYCFNHGATDADGDSLSYSLIDPMTGAGTTVTYFAGWSATQPITSVPGLTVDPLTGDICMTPQLLEVSVMAVLVEEWRDGILIGSVVRDIQVRVITCTNTIPTLSGINGSTNFTTSVCAGNTITFDVFSMDEDAGQNVTLTWNNGIAGGTFTSVGTPFPTGTFSWTPTAADVSSTPYCFTVTVTDDACPYNGTQTFAFCITVTGLNVNVSTSDPNCGTSNGSATASVTGGSAPYTYAWSSGASTSFDTGLSAGSYSLTVTDATGCSSLTNFIIGPGIPPANINFTITNVDCYGAATGSIDATVTGGGGGAASYLWSNGSTTNVISGLTSGMYILTVNLPSGCTASDTAFITQPPQPLQVNINKTNVTCNGLSNGTAAASISGGTAPYSIGWSTGATTMAIGGLGASTYTYTVTDDNGCNFSGSVIITEPTAISVGATLITPVTCNGLSDGMCSLTIGGGTGSLEVVWATTPVQIGNTASGLAVGTYSYIITDDNGCTLTNPIVMTEPAPLNLSLTVNNAQCYDADNGSIQVNVSGGTAPYTITLNSIAMMNGATLNSLAPGSYTALVTDNNGCSTNQTVTITEPDPVSLITSPDLTICPGDTITLYAYSTGGTGVYTYSWNNGLGNSISQVIAPTMTTTYTVTVTDQNGCTSVPGNTLVTVNDINNINLTLTGNTTICEGESVLLSANLTNGIGTYTAVWNGGVLTGFGPHTFVPAGDTVFTITVTDVCLNSITQSIPVTVHPLPVINLPALSASACGYVMVEFSNSEPVQAGDSYTWLIAGATYNFPDPTHQFNASGNYPITLTIENVYGCSSSETISANITVFPQVDAIIDAVSHTANEFTPIIQFINASLFADTYSWDFGDGSTSTEATPNHTYSSTGNYVVTMVGNNQYGCPDTVSMEVQIIPEHTLYVPNAFTPNGDGWNDVFAAKGTHILEYEMRIFDRWGEQIFYTQSLDGGWDGTYRGELSKEDVFVYKIKYKTNDKEVLQKEGHVSLLK